MKKQQDMVFAYSTSDVIWNTITGTLLGGVAFLACNGSAYMQPHMTAPLLATMLACGTAVGLIVKPVRFLKYFDAKIGVQPEWINGRCSNVVMMWVFHCLPLWIIASIMMTAMYNTTTELGPGDVSVEDTVGSTASVEVVSEDMSSYSEEMVNLQRAAADYEQLKHAAYYNNADSQELADAVEAFKEAEDAYRLKYREAEISNTADNLSTASNESSDAEANAAVVKEMTNVKFFRVFRSLFVNFTGGPAFVLFFALLIRDKLNKKKSESGSEFDGKEETKE